MKRRGFLITAVGAVAAAGCVGEQEEPEEPAEDQTEEEPTEEEPTEEEPTEEETEEEPTEEPIYDSAEQEALIPPLEIFPEGWKRDDESNPEFDAVFFNEDETIAVLIGAGAGESVEDASEAFEETRSLYRDPQDFDIGDEAFWDTRDSQAITFFRHSNAIGEVRAVQEVGVDIEPDVSRSQDYAFEMYDHWQTLIE